MGQYWHLAMWSRLYIFPTTYGFNCTYYWVMYIVLSKAISIREFALTKSSNIRNWKVKMTKITFMPRHTWSLIYIYFEAVIMYSIRSSWQATLPSSRTHSILWENSIVSSMDGAMVGFGGNGPPKFFFFLKYIIFYI